MTPLPPGASRAAAAREGLRRLVQDPAAWPAPTTLLLRNRLLDECGGDARALVALLVQAAEAGIPDRIPPAGTPPSAWESARGALVVSLVADGFIQREMAVWAVEAWAYALGTIGGAALTVAPAPAPAPRVTPTAARGVSGATRADARAGASPRPASAVFGAPRTVPLAVPPVPPAPPPWRGGQPAVAPRFLRWITAGSLVVIVAGVVALLVWTAQRASGGDDVVASADTETSASPRALEVAGPEPASPPGPGAPAVTARSAPVDSARLLYVTPAIRPPVLLERGSVPYVPNPTATAPDRVRLREGRTLIGRVEVVRAAVVVFRDGESGLRYEIDKRDIAEIVTEFGTTVRFGAGGAPLNERASSPVMRGLGGRYDVRYAVAGVDGTPECRALWRAPPARDVATVAHAPGSDSLSIAFAGGGTFFAVVDREGQFATTFVIKPDQAYSSTALTTRLNGRFTFTGFEATVTVLAYQRARYGRDIACQSKLAATGALRAAAPGR